MSEQTGSHPSAERLAAYRLGRLTDVKQFEEVIVKAGNEGRTVYLRDVAKVLEAAGRKQGADLRIEEVPQGEHREADWAARLDRVLVFLFGRGP